MNTHSHDNLPAAPAPPGHILVIRGGAIGDFILTLPVLAALRREYPDARLAILGHPHIARLAQAAGLADEIHPIEARWLIPLFAPEGELGRKAVEFFAGIDLILSYLYDPESVFRTNLGRWSSARFIAGPHRPDESVPLHATEVFLKPLEALGIMGAEPVPRLRLGVPSRTHAPAAAASPLTIALHPGSGAERKNWPEAKWGELISRLLDGTSLDLLLVGGEAEGARLDRLAAGRSSPHLHLAQRLPLLDLAWRLSDCTVFVGHDSGISHLAAALGLPGVVLWGDSAEAVWRPRSDRCLLLRDPRGIAEISVSRVLAALGSLRENPSGGSHAGLFPGGNTGLDPTPSRTQDRL